MIPFHHYLWCYFPNIFCFNILVLGILLYWSGVPLPSPEHSLALPFIGIGMKTDLFQSCGHCWVFQICWHIECSTISFSNAWKWKGKVKSCLTLSDPMDCSPPGSSVHGILQARVLEWGAIAFSWTFFGIAFHWDWNEKWPFPVLWLLLSFPNLLAYWVQRFHPPFFSHLP